ncbi:MAG: asparaginase [Acidobacteriota bacterium]
MSSRRVFVAYTGGTLGMKKTPEGYAPVSGYLQGLMDSIADLHHPDVPQWEVKEFDPLLDSANMAPSDWARIAHAIEARYDEFDGFVVIHGTDTMAYSASALSFMLEGLAKPVILTGSQIPLAELRSDARDNLLAALLLAGNYAIPEVCIYFGNSLFRGNRTRKVSTGALDAFASPNYPLLGTVGVDIQVYHHRLLEAPPPGNPLTVPRLSDPHIAAVRLFPGITADTLRNFLRAPLRGLVLETYGAGNGPVRNQAFLDTLEEAIQRGVVIVNCTQCHQGTVHPQAYATGRGLAKIGVISGGDMTAEAALAKLYYLFGKGNPYEIVMGQISFAVCGELLLNPR